MSNNKTDTGGSGWTQPMCLTFGFIRPAEFAASIPTHATRSCSRHLDVCPKRFPKSVKQFSDQAASSNRANAAGLRHDKLGLPAMKPGYPEDAKIALVK